jgi:hypothetical protein
MGLGSGLGRVLVVVERGLRGFFGERDLVGEARPAEAFRVRVVMS